MSFQDPALDGLLSTSNAPLCKSIKQAVSQHGKADLNYMRHHGSDAVMLLLAESHHHKKAAFAESRGN